MEQSKRFAFIDDSGDARIDFPLKGTSSHFVVAAVVIPEGKVAEAEDKVEQIRKRHFPSGEIKSSKVGTDDRWRLDVLHELMKIDFHALVGVTDKSRFRPADIEAPGSQVKLLSGHLHQNLQRIFSSLHIVADTNGDETFMPGFADYVTSDVPRSLFDTFDVEFTDSRSHSLLQMAEFIAGSVRRHYICQRKPAGVNFMRDILPKVTLREWPGNHSGGFTTKMRSKSALNSRFAMTALRLARNYVDSHLTDNAGEALDRVAFLEFLLCKLKFGSPTVYISTKEILKHLNAFRDEPCNRYYLRASVVAPLRDLGVLIASSPQGYKIPVTAEELYEFINHSLSIINPVLNRLEKCRDEVRLATDGQLDLFDRGEYQLLRKLLHDDYIRGAVMENW